MDDGELFEFAIIFFLMFLLDIKGLMCYTNDRSFEEMFFSQD